MSEDRGQITEDREQRTEDRGVRMGNVEWGIRNVEAESIGHALKDKDIG